MDELKNNELPSLHSMNGGPQPQGLATQVGSRPTADGWTHRGRAR
jgi:hypothetical protein